MNLKHLSNARYSILKKCILANSLEHIKSSNLKKTIKGLYFSHESETINYFKNIN